MRSATQRSFLDTPGFTNSPTARVLVETILETPAAPLAVPLRATLAELRAEGTFWSLQKSNQPPWPGRLFPELPAYQVTPKNFVVDDRSVDYPALRAVQEVENSEADGPIIFGAESFDYSSTTNLWLEIPTNGVASNLVQVLVHNTSAGLPYTLLTKTDLNLPAWTPELIITGAVGTVTPTQLPQNNRTNLFIWAHAGLPDSFVEILFQPLDQEVLEGDMVTFSVTAAALGGGPLTYQWTRNGVPISGATNRSYTMEVVWETDEAGYAVTVSNGAFALGSRTAELLVYPGTDRIFYTRLFGPRQDYQFKRGHTYYVGMAVDCYGATVIEGGAVIKFDVYGSDATVRIHGSLECQTESYFPAILTSVDDDSAGEVELWSAHYPEPYTNGYPYLDLAAASSGVISNLHFRFADRAVSVPEASRRLDVWHSQFYRCYAAVENYAGANATVGFHNALLAGCGTAVLAGTNSYVLTAEHLTAEVGSFWYAAPAPTRISLTNSIILGTFSGGGVVQTQSAFINTTNVVFQPTAYGHYYLPENSPGHQAGTTNISPALLTAFRHKSTMPPLEIPGGTTFNGEVTLFPQVPRYTNGPPDAGYYYDALDYVVADLQLKNARLTIQPGTALAAANLTNQTGGWIFNGIRAYNGAEVISRGTPTAPNIFTTTKLVQEVPPTEWAALQAQINFPFGLLWFVPWHEAALEHAIPPRFDFEFSKFYLPFADFHLAAGYFIGSPTYGGAARVASHNSLMDLRFQNCELHGGQIYLGRPSPFYHTETNYLGGGSLHWQNSLFDGVNIQLDPSRYRLNGLMDCDISLQAENNLFRGGAWFWLSPLPASMGPWTFRDNLFDQVHFLRRTNAPLDFDYNGYWPMALADTFFSDEELLPLPEGGAHEVTLSSAPPYQAGPLGKYYLPQLTPLYHAASQPAAEAGLSQYTVRTNQITEGQDAALFGNNKATIGLHYVATTNASSSAPKDTDGDGVPDAVEDQNGNGLVDANETSPALAMTDGVTADAASSVYDDIDLSGNGLVGRIKRALGQGPLDANNPLTLKQITTGEEPIATTFEVPVSYEAVTAAGFFRLNRDGSAAIGEQFLRATNGNCLLVFNQYYDPPGFHCLSATFDMAGQIASGPLQPFVSNNELQFENAGAMFDENGAFLDAKIFVPQADYVINLYDASTTNEAHILSITNTTYNGLIQEDWGATNANGTAFTGASVRAEFVLAAAGGGGGGSPSVNTNKPSKPLQRATGSLSEWGLNFNWAYMYTPTNGALATAFAKGGEVWNGMQGVVDYLIAPRYGWEHYNSEFNRFVPPIGSEYPGYLTSRAMITNNLYPTLLGAKQFFCYAHGNSNAMGEAVGDTCIKAKEIGGILQNSRSNNVIIANNPYRFVFLDGCSTASGLDWQTAFGIAEKTEFTRNKTGAQAFVGWAKPVGDWLGGDDASAESLKISKAYTKTLQGFYLDWMNKTPLATCIDHASLSLTDTVPLPVPENANALIIFSDGSTYQSGSSVGRIIIVGHPGLKVDGVDPGDDARNDYARR